MKKIVFFAILTIIGVIKVSAQQVDILQENYADTRIEELSKEVAELSQKLEKLEEDYEYLALVNQLNSVLYEFEIFNNEVNIAKNELMIMCYNSRFDIDFYLLKEDMYDTLQEFYALYSRTKDNISKQISNLTFSNKRLDYNYIYYRYNKLDTTLLMIENSLHAYKQYLDVYKNLGKGF